MDLMALNDKIFFGNGSFCIIYPTTNDSILFQIFDVSTRRKTNHHSHDGNKYFEMYSHDAHASFDVQWLIRHR